jgi:hypothetical protein
MEKSSFGEPRGNDGEVRKMVTELRFQCAKVCGGNDYTVNILQGSVLETVSETGLEPGDCLQRGGWKLFTVSWPRTQRRY